MEGTGADLMAIVDHISDDNPPAALMEDIHSKAAQLPVHRRLRRNCSSGDGSRRASNRTVVVVKSIHALGHIHYRYDSLLEVQEGAAPPAHGNQRSGMKAQPEWIA